MRANTERVTRLDYCQYLLVSQINSSAVHLIGESILQDTLRERDQRP